MKYAMSIACAICIVISSSSFSKSPDRKAAISYTKLNSDYLIIGPLGTELGRIMELEVEKTKLNVKSDPPVLKVLAVDGKKLEKAITCKYRMLLIDDKFEFHKTYKIKAYQDGYFTGTPNEVLKDIMFQTTDYFFETALVVYKYIY